jgi:hypothetical protein
MNNITEVKLYLSPQELIEEALKTAHLEHGASLWDIKQALQNVLQDVEVMIEDCKVKESLWNSEYF